MSFLSVRLTIHRPLVARYSHWFPPPRRSNTGAQPARRSALFMSNTPFTLPACGPVAPVTTGPITIEVPDDVFFHSLEINCPDAGIRRRASFRRNKASTSGVPIAEECTVTFQGSEPAKTTIRGGQRKKCLNFNPTDCRLY